MKKMSASSLIAGTLIHYNCYSEKGELLITRDTILTQEHMRLLKRRNIFDLYMLTPSEEKQGWMHHLGSVFSPPPEEQLYEAPTEPARPQSDRAAEKRTPEDALSALLDLRKKKLEDLLKSPPAARLDLNLDKSLLADRPLGGAVANMLSHVSPVKRSPEYKEQVMTFYAQALDVVRGFLEDMVRHTPRDVSPIQKVVDELIKIFISDRDVLFVAAAAAKAQDDEYVYSHALNSCIFAISIAVSSGYSKPQVSMIGTGALLYDIGMLLVSKDIRNKEGKLDRHEFGEIQKHPVIGLHVLERVRRMPDPIKYMIYQSHERENGSGYPHQRGSRLIHRFAKIIQVADIFEALTSPRKHRGAYTPFESVEMLVRMTQKGLVSHQFVKALLTYSSLFPVGSVVELSDHRLARVVHANSSILHRPIVNVISDNKGKLLPEDKIYQEDLSEQEGLSVVRAFSPDHLKGKGPLFGL